MQNPCWAPFSCSNSPSVSPEAVPLWPWTLSEVRLSHTARCHSTSSQKDLLCHRLPSHPHSAMLRSIVIIMVIIIVAISLSPSQIFMAAVPHKSFRLMSHKEMLPRSLPRNGRRAAAVASLGGACGARSLARSLARRG